MPIFERSTIVPLGLHEAWEAFFGNQMQNWRRLSDSVDETRDFRWREDGAPEYVMINRMGPFRPSHPSDYPVCEPPHRAEDDTLDSILGGRWTTLHESVDGGIRVIHRWDVVPKGVMKIRLPLMRRGFQKSFQSDLDNMAQRIVRSTTLQ